MPGRRSMWTLRRSLITLLAVAMILQPAASAWAWGSTGHRVIAKLAERHLTDQAKAEIKALLEPGESLADCSTWADEVRGQMRHTAPWHYVDVPLDEPRYDDKWAADNPHKGYIVPKVRELWAVLKDRAKPVQQRREVLRFLVHLIEVLHMPLHVGDNHDRGGNDTQVRFFDRGSNMHRVWDSGIIDHAGRGEDGWLADLIAMDMPEAFQKAQGG
jgi:S1/P1 Nuclease